jgi:hypothetical protein
MNLINARLNKCILFKNKFSKKKLKIGTLLLIFVFLHEFTEFYNISREFVNLHNLFYRYERQTKQR